MYLNDKLLKYCHLSNRTYTSEPIDVARGANLLSKAKYLSQLQNGICKLFNFSWRHLDTGLIQCQAVVVLAILIIILLLCTVMLFTTTVTIAIYQVQGVSVYNLVKALLINHFYAFSFLNDTVFWNFNQGRNKTVFKKDQSTTITYSLIKSAKNKLIDKIEIFSVIFIAPEGIFVLSQVPSEIIYVILNLMFLFLEVVF